MGNNVKTMKFFTDQLSLRTLSVCRMFCLVAIAIFFSSEKSFATSLLSKEYEARPAVELPPNGALDVQPNSFINCGSFAANVVVVNSEFGVSYQLRFNGVNTGTAVIGTGSNIVLTSASLSVSGTLSVRATDGLGDSVVLLESIPVTIFQNPSTANAGSNRVNCGLSIAMNATAPVIGVGTWTQLSGPGTASFANVNSRNSLVTVPLQGSYVFVWTVSNGTCPSSSDDVTIQFFEPPTTSNAGTDQLVCGLSATLDGNIPTVGNAAWFFVSGPGGLSFSDTTDPNSNVNASGPGTYTIQWIIFNGACAFNTDIVAVTFTEDQVTADAGADQTICALTTTLQANSAAPFAGQWTQASGPAFATFDDATNPNATVTTTTGGVYSFAWSIDNAPCPVSEDFVEINFNLFPEVCNGIDDDCDLLIDDGFDMDGDGYTTCQNDCDDNNFLVNPGALEVCDGIDNDCDTDIDEGVLTTYYIDNDGDNFGNAAISIDACIQPVGFVTDNTDCDDALASINPSATEICDGLDNNCNLAIDEGVLITYYRDADGDGFGNPSILLDACTNPIGYVTDNTDCNDSNPAINTAATEVCDALDNDCDTDIDEGVQLTFYQDADGDLFGNPAVSLQACTAPAGYVADNTDCDDTIASVNSGATEVCDGFDNDCDTAIDEGLLVTFYQDADGDGFGNTAISLTDCVAPAGYVANDTDCDDTNPTVFTGAAELCDGLDNDCDLAIDEGLLMSYYADTDGDSFGDPLSTITACTPPLGYVLSNTDCDDTDAAINPSALELCDAIDNDCDLLIDEGLTTTTYYIDADGDSFGNPAISIVDCTQPAGYVTNNTDCNDADPTINPSALEICDGVDNNCDLTIDNGTDFTFFADTDGDGFGDPANFVLACTAPAGFVTDNTDCDDTNNAINPSEIEICDGIDNNCDLAIDEGVLNTYFQDADGDTYGDPFNTIDACTQPIGFVTNDTDCDDTDPNSNPAAVEICDTFDNDCDLDIDEGLLTTYYADNDGDGFGDPTILTDQCTQPTGFVTNNTDCDDTDPLINSGATELCDGIDNDCDTSIDEGVLLTFYIDADADGFGDVNNSAQACSVPTGYVANALDCNDADPTINPSASEVCDGIDNNCDTAIDEGLLMTYYADADSDGFGNAAATVQACSLPVGFVTNNTDCDDSNPSVNPAAVEVCDGVDNNCNTAIDEGLTITFYADADSDGFGDPTTTAVACTAPVGFVTDNSDCDDSNPAINIGAVEVCDGIDNNCDLTIDEGLTTTYYADLDGDTFGDPTNFVDACTQPTGFVIDFTDCDDTNAAINPLGTELCDGLDNNCDLTIDEGFPLVSFYADTDGDTFGDPNNFIDACAAPPGFVANDTDCDDTNNSVFPGATELCDGLDNDCDFVIDNGLVLQPFYADTDSDGFGDLNNSLNACAAPPGYVSDNTDCDDADDTVNSSAIEICDGLDNDCDIAIDEDAGDTYYADTDNDGFGDASTSVLSCTPVVGFVLDNTDCDDTNTAINPAATEICDALDNNCDLFIDEGFVTETYYQDADNDGFGNPAQTITSCIQPTGYVTDNSDCDDTNANINIGEVEVCDGIDNNCDLTIDENLTTPYFADTDGDGFGDPANVVDACAPPVGYVLDNTDCDDSNDTVFPGATELCDGLDNDCDVVIDNGFVLETFYADTDGDGFGDDNNSIDACVAPTGYVTDNTDCDDANADIFPGNPELCDGLDNDCDLVIDNGFVLETFYADTDGDGFGDNNNSADACVAPTGYVTDNTDCDDANADIFPGNPELCDGFDNDCDLVIDNGFVLETFYADTDGDGFGDLNNSIDACVAPTGYVTDNTDCDDANADIFPGNPELCDGLDNDCDVVIDNGFVLETFYADTDGDGFGDLNNSIDACVAPTGYVTDNTDCDDANADIFPGNPELCDGLDNDCDLVIDNGFVLETFYADTDGDGFGDNNNSVDACVAPTGYVTDNTDCDDANADIFPGNPELCDGLDNDCDLVIDNGFVLETFYADTDGDGFGDNNNSVDACVAPTGYVTDNTDCDDANADIFPGNPELCDGLDNDCDLVIDNGFVLETFYADTDGDGFGDNNNSVDACVAPTGYVIDNTDCDDANADIFPGNPELCDGLDNDCDLVIDNGFVLETFYADTDGDGFGDNNNSVDACVAPTGYVIDNTDCDDANADIFPGNPEVCDGFDNDCDLVIDNGFVLETFYADTDGDGFGDLNNSIDACVAPTGYVTDNTDCDDANADIFPGNPEVCDGLDNDCDVVIDNGFVLETFYADTDGDGFGDDNNSIDACVAPTGYVTDNTDCDDTLDSVFPGATELCDGLDNNCDTNIDEGLDANTYYADTDGDGFGDPTNTITACAVPQGYVENNSDCDDSNETVFPGAEEVCDGIDNNCDTNIDEGLVLITYYADFDGDGFGDPAESEQACSAPDGFVTDNTDCDDSNEAIYPGAEEVCDGLDNNCDTNIDEGLDPLTYYADADGDGFGDPNVTVLACLAPAGFVDNNLDCDDTDESINPDAEEICDSIDNDCDLAIDEDLGADGCIDTDGDTVRDSEDLDDDNDGILDATELLTAQNNGDTDGDGIPDIIDLDSDNDGINDVIEAGGSDPDGDGTIGIGQITDANGDGLSDDLPITGLDPIESDSDGLPDFQDTESDGDGIEDADEIDADGDGLGPDDTDGDGVPNYQDNDDDGDGLLTSEEFDFNGDGIAPDDCNYDGVPNYLDPEECLVFFPEGFSPNGDGINDVYVIEGLAGSQVITIDVFNRWGAVVYTSSDYANDWDGTSNTGSSTGELPVGTYFYLVKIGTEERSGYITLWR
jgi:gliding motility-associated-like protein